MKKKPTFCDRTMAIKRPPIFCEKTIHCKDCLDEECHKERKGNLLELYHVVGSSGFEKLIWARSPQEALRTFEDRRKEIDYLVFRVEMANRKKGFAKLKFMMEKDALW